MSLSSLLGRLAGHAKLPGEHEHRFCAACHLAALPENPIVDFRHHPDCYVYLPSGACDCGLPGFWAHQYQCPVTVEGDVAPAVPAATR